VASRLVHWTVAVVYGALFLSGLALFHPVFFWISSLFGGGQTMRLLHPFLGAGFALLFFAYAARIWRDNRWLPTDSEWVRSMFRYLRKEHVALDTHKYNAGQKLMFWSTLLVVAGLLVTGLVLWQPYFAPRFDAGTKRVAGLLHAVFAFIMFVGIGVHWYAAIWTKGSIRAMVRGTVSRAWARFHHPAWYREIVGKEAK
jgi:formate dehydrogenase subunit gamma